MINQSSPGLVKTKETIMTLNYDDLRREFKAKSKQIQREDLLRDKAKNASELRVKEATKGNWNGIYANQKGHGLVANSVLLLVLVHALTYII